MRRLLVLLILPFLMFAYVFLRYGSVQGSKYSYLYQAYVSPGYHHGIIRPPCGYTGTWRMWYANGRLAILATFTNGIPDGIYTEWDKTGGHAFTMYYHRGIEVKIRYLGGDWEYRNGYSVATDPDPEVAEKPLAP